MAATTASISSAAAPWRITISIGKPRSGYSADHRCSNSRTRAVHRLRDVFRLTEADPHDGRDARLLHRHPVDGIRRLHRPRIVGDHKELGAEFELVEQARESTDIGVVER